MKTKKLRKSLTLKKLARNIGITRKKLKTEYYNLHKVTLISIDPVASCKNIKLLFGSAVGEMQSPPDIGLRERGVKWIKFNKGNHPEFHFVPPFKLDNDKMIRKMINLQKTQDPLKTQLFENHMGIYVPDLTPIVLNTLKHKRPCHLNRRNDGMYQFYTQIDGCLDYLDIDSLTLNTQKLKKLYPNFHIYTFLENTKLVKKFKNSSKKKRYLSSHTKLYFDPVHNAPREVTILKNNNLIIKGKDKMNGKRWKITGKINKNNDAVLDFSSKGGPKNIKAKFKEDNIKFGDGNSWRLIYKIEH